MRYAIVVAALLLGIIHQADAQTPRPFMVNDWCYTYDFIHSDYDVAITSGGWSEGAGIITLGGALAFSREEDFYTRPSVAIARFIRGYNATGEISIAAAGQILGIPVIINKIIPVDSEYLITIPISPLYSASAGNTINISLQSSAELVLQSLTIAGNGASPTGTNDCASRTPTPQPSPTPMATATPENCHLHDDTFNVYANDDQWVSTDFATSPSCNYTIEITGQYEDAAGPADAFYSVRTEWDFCTMETAGRSWAIFYDFRLSPHTFTPSINGFDGAAKGQWVEGVGFVASDIRQSGSVRANAVEIRSAFPVVNNNIERYACLVYQWVPGSVPAPPRNNWSIGTLLSNNTYDQLLTHGSPDGIRTGGGVGRMLDGALVYGLRSAQCNGCTDPFENTGYAAIVGLALSGSGPNPLTGHYDWLPSENLIFESSEGTEVDWHDSPPPRSESGYTVSAQGNGSPWRFRIPQKSGNSGYLTVRVRASDSIPQPTPTITPTPTTTPLFGTPSGPAATACGFEPGTLLSEDIIVSTDGSLASTNLVTDWNCVYGVEVSGVNAGGGTVSNDNLIFSAHPASPGAAGSWKNHLEYYVDGSFTFVHVGTNQKWKFSVETDDFPSEDEFLVRVYVIGPVSEIDIDDDDPFVDGGYYNDMVNQWRTAVAAQPTYQPTYTPPWVAGPDVVHATFYPTMTARAEQTLQAMYAIPDWGDGPNRDGFGPGTGLGIGTPEAPPSDGVTELLGTTVAELRELPRDMNSYIPNPNSALLMGHLKWTVSCSSIYEVLGANWGAIACHTTVGVVLASIMATVFISVRLVSMVFKFAVWMLGKILKVIPFMG